MDAESPGHLFGRQKLFVLLLVRGKHAGHCGSCIGCFYEHHLRGTTLPALAALSRRRRSVKQRMFVSSATRPLDPLELAWAAGFFDGEGSTSLHHQASRPRSVRLDVVISQKGTEDGPPPTLLRFQKALGGIGRMTRKPSRGLVYQWAARGRDEGFLTIALLWHELGSRKKAQANEAVRSVLDHYETISGSRPAPRPHVVQLRTVASCASAAQRDAAWAAGFLDAEGYFGIPKRLKRARGPDWLCVRASATQRATGGEDVPEVLLRLRRTLGGRIEAHGGTDTYKWTVEGGRGVRSVLGRVGRHLGTIKRRQADAALALFESQTRLRGDAARCLRGHPYSRALMKGGRLRKICDPCDRLNERRRRAKFGIPPRPFKNVSRRYTE